MPQTTVLTVGSLHYDIMVKADHLPRKDETSVGSRWYPKFGGKGGNQAVAVARAGVASRMFGAEAPSNKVTLGCIGDGEASKMMAPGSRGEWHI